MAKAPGAGTSMADVQIAMAKVFLPLAGGTLTGPLTLAGAPTKPLDAATKAYTDSRITQVLSLKPSVADKASLPAAGNTAGDVRQTKDTNLLYLFDGKSWSPMGKASTPIPQGSAAQDGWVLRWDAATATWLVQAPPKSVPDGVNDMDLLTWDTAAQSWMTAADELGDETNVNLATDGSADKGTLFYEDNTNSWDVRPIEVSDLKEVGNIVPNDGDVLQYDAALGKWVLDVIQMPKPTQFRGAVADAAALATIPAPQPGDVAVTKDDQHLHVFGNGSWDDIGPATTSTDHLGDEDNVNINAQSDGGTLVYDDALDEFDVRRISVEELAEIAPIVPNDGDVIQWDLATRKWILDRIAVEQLADVNLPGAPHAGDVLAWDGTQWTTRSVASSTSFKGTVANAAALPTTAALGDTYVTVDDGHIHIATTASAVGPPAVAAVFDNIGPSGVKGAKGDPQKVIIQPNDPGVQPEGTLWLETP